jgi:omega-6 fatty acid desaturase (delta-12 desaturase)
MVNKKIESTAVSWQSVVSKYNKPQIRKSIWQLTNSLAGYLILWLAMSLTIKISIWITLPLIILAAGFLIRIFIIFHDCGHGSFFKSNKLNLLVGKLCGILAFTPYYKWTNSHKLHHRTVGNLDKRGLGDVWTLTLDEYKEKGNWNKFIYRLFRHPIFLLGVGGPLSFIILNRFSTKKMTPKQRYNVYFTNIILISLALIVSWLIGWQTYLLLQLSVMYIAAIVGVYLFYLQHQYDDVYWCRNNEWDYKTMALQGSSFFKLPAILQWFTGNIGFHHVHHLAPTIPNYNLSKCHRENDMFREVNAITFFKSFRSLKLRLWDESNQRIVTFASV